MHCAINRVLLKGQFSMPERIVNVRARSGIERKGAVPRSGRLRKPRVKAEVVAAMARAILTGEVAQGSFMPTEAELCQQYGVSRTVVREATKVLESKGLLSIRSRVGTQVQDKAVWNLLDPDMLAWAEDSSEQPEYIASLMEIRRIIEPAAVELAAMRATERDILDLENAFERMAAFPIDEVEYYAEADVDFHNALLVATRNQVLVQLGRIIGVSLKSLLMRTAQAGTHPKRALELHGEIVVAIKERDPQRARKAIVAIVESASRDLKL